MDTLAMHRQLQGKDDSQMLLELGRTILGHNWVCAAAQTQQNCRWFLSLCSNFFSRVLCGAAYGQRLWGVWEVLPRIPRVCACVCVLRAFMS